MKLQAYLRILECSQAVAYLWRSFPTGWKGISNDLTRGAYLEMCQQVACGLEHC